MRPKRSHECERGKLKLAPRAWRSARTLACRVPTLGDARRLLALVDNCVIRPANLLIAREPVVQVGILSDR